MCACVSVLHMRPYICACELLAHTRTEYAQAWLTKKTTNVMCPKNLSDSDGEHACTRTRSAREHVRMNRNQRWTERCTTVAEYARAFALRWVSGLAMPRQYWCVGIESRGRREHRRIALANICMSDQRWTTAHACARPSATLGGV